MKAKIVTTVLGILISLLSSTQVEKGTLYKSGQWADIAGKGGFAQAMENPTYEKVEIFIADKNIKVTFGT